MTDAAHYKDRLMQRLPKVLQEGSNLSNLFVALGDEMGRMSTGTKLLMRSRWINWARGWPAPETKQSEKTNTELGRIGNLFGLVPGRGESTARFKFRLLEFIDIHKDGLGTASGLLRLAALVYRAEGRPVIYWEEDVATAEFSVIDKDGKKQDLKLQLVDNPVEKKDISIKVNENIEFSINNYSLIECIPKIRFTAKYGNILLPMLVHRESGLRILYVGHIFKDETLFLENRTEPVRIGNDGRLQRDGFRFDDKKAVFDTPEGKFDVKFGGPDLLLIGSGARFNNRNTFFDTEKGKFNIRFAGFDTQTNFPALKPGINHFTYRTIDKKALKSYLFHFKNSDKLLKNVSDEENAHAPVDISFSWSAKVPACFSLQIPGEYVPPFMNNMEQLQKALYGMMKYGKAAGIIAKIDLKYSFAEILNISDALRTKMDIIFNEQGKLRDRDFTAEMDIKFRDNLAPKDKCGTSGIYDNAYLDYAAFVNANEIGEDGRFNEGQYNSVRFTNKEGRENE